MGSSQGYIDLSYDALGTKLWKTHTVVGSNGLVGTTYSYYDDFVYLGSTLDQVRFDGGHITFSSTGTPQYHYYHQDHLGSVRVVTDASGNVEQRRSYYPFGASFREDATTDGNRIKFCGKELDRMHALNDYDFGARTYLPVLGRFTQMDPLCEKYYNISPYAYCANNPVKYVDPDGRKIRICQKDRNQVLGYINKLAQGTFAVDKSGYLFLSKPSNSKGFSKTYTESLVRAINNKEKTIMVFVDNYYLDKDDNKQDISLKGEGTTKEFFNGNISVVISGKTYNGLVDKDGNSISDKPEFILAHEIAGHAEPRLNDNGKGDVVNAVEIENAIRRETNEKERKEEPKHVQ